MIVNHRVIGSLLLRGCKQFSSKCSPVKHGQFHYLSFCIFSWKTMKLKMFIVVNLPFFLSGWSQNMKNQRVSLKFIAFCTIPEILLETQKLSKNYLIVFQLKMQNKIIDRVLFENIHWKLNEFLCNLENFFTNGKRKSRHFLMIKN